MTTTRATKLTKTQTAAWNRIRHALPAVFGELFGTAGSGPIGCRMPTEPGETWLGENLTATVEKLQAAGLIRITAIGNRSSDRGIIVADRGERVAKFGPVELFDGRVCPFFAVSVETLDGWNPNWNNGKVYHQFSGKNINTKDAAAVAATHTARERAMLALMADGWKVIDETAAKG